jgi:predicted nicotinamide N-methyase
MFVLTGNNYTTRNPWFSILLVSELFTGERMVKYSQICIQKLIEDGVNVLTIKHWIPRLVAKFRLKF